jgi:LysM repeat protein
MKEDEGLYRFARFVKRAVIGAVVLAAGVVLAGFLFLMRQVDPPTAWAGAARELLGSVLHYGETAQRVARVYRRRPTNYFRAANGLLVATEERLIFVGIEPRDKLAGEDAPATIVYTEFRNDTSLRLVPRRVYLGTATGAVANRGDRSVEFAAAHGHEAELDSLARYVDRTHAMERRRAAADRALHAAIDSLVKLPLRYPVTRGDALSTIATRFGATPEQIRSWNHLTSNVVRIGDTLLVKPPG